MFEQADKKADEYQKKLDEILDPVTNPKK